MTEEKVTKTILSYLQNNLWDIVTFDFPQSGTGKMLHPSGSSSEKNKGGIIPDIVAVKDGLCVFFENKDRYYYPDFIKINDLIVNDTYKESIWELIGSFNVHTIRYGIGLPTAKYTKNADKNKELTDFIIGVNDDYTIKAIYDKWGIF